METMLVAHLSADRVGRLKRLVEKGGKGSIACALYSRYEDVEELVRAIGRLKDVDFGCGV